MDVATKFGLTVSFPKTKHMVAGHDDTGGVQLAADEQHQDQAGPHLCVERVEDFNLLGSRLQHDGGGDVEVAARLRSAGAAW